MHKRFFRVRKSTIKLVSVCVDPSMFIYVRTSLSLKTSRRHAAICSHVTFILKKIIFKELDRNKWCVCVCGLTNDKW